MANLEKFNFNHLSPFKWFVLNNFPFLDADFDAMTEWQLFQKIGEWINKIIDSQNAVGGEMEKVISAYIELYNYVDNFFKNLDLQEEVDNKLNEMAEDGTLLNLLSNYTYLTKIYNTVQDMINDNDIVLNQKCYCLGYYNINDGGQGYYCITNVENSNKYQINLDKNNLYAELITNTLYSKQIGLIGDGLTDENNLLNRLFNYEYNKIILQKGIYYINSNILINISNKNINFEDSKILVGNNINLEDLIQISGSNIINNLKIETSNNCIAKHLIQIRNCNNSIFNNWIIDIKQTQSIDSKITPIDIFTNNNNIDFNNLTILHYGNCAGGGLWVREGTTNGNTYNINFNNSTFIKQNGDETVAVWGWLGTVRNINFNNCYFKTLYSLILENNNYLQQYIITVGQDGVCENVNIINSIIESEYLYNGLINTIYKENSKNKNFNVINSIINIENKVGDNYDHYTLGYEDYSSENKELIWTFKNCTITNKSKFDNNGLFFNCIVDNCDINYSCKNNLFYKSLCKNTNVESNNIYIAEKSNLFYNNIKFSVNTIGTSFKNFDFIVGNIIECTGSSDSIYSYIRNDSYDKPFNITNNVIYGATPYLADNKTGVFNNNYIKTKTNVEVNGIVIKNNIINDEIV